MSERQSHMLSELEIQPPVTAWQRISAELDEIANIKSLGSKLNSIAILPPATNWENIVSALDEPQLIADYATRLNSLEIIPPVSAWHSISKSLPARSAAQRSVVPSLVKYAVAAALLLFLILGGIRLITMEKENSVASNTPSLNEKAPVINDNTLPGKVADSSAIVKTDEAKENEALEESKKTYAKLDQPSTRSKIKNASDFFFIADDYDYEPIVGTRSPVYTEDAEPALHSVNMAKRYVLLMTPEGNIIRVSRKLEELVCCVSGEDEAPDCVDQMKKWRDKIANPAKAHSPGNFMDIVNMASSLQEH